VIGSLLVLAAVLPFLGFQVALLLFLMYHLRIRARLGWVKSLIISVAGSVGVFYLFTLGLKVSLPVASVPPFSLIGL
jgi:putative tricarboxylic transport membrane protein